MQPHRRGRMVALLVVAAVLVLLPLAVLLSGRDASVLAAVVPVDQAAEEGPIAPVADVRADVAPDPPGPDEVPASDDPLPVTRPLGRVGGLLVHAPASDPLVIGFHEAANPHALAIEPVGVLTANHNTTRFTPLGEQPHGSAYLVLSSRGRTPAPTSAVDVVMRDGEPVRAPVSGRVSDVRTYWLYGRHLDQRIEIVPDAAPWQRIVLVHVDEVRVGPGDRVVRGDSYLAGTARRFPVASQIDRETEPERWPHVHLEVQPVDAPRPGDDLEG